MKRKIPTEVRFITTSISREVDYFKGVERKMKRDEETAKWMNSPAHKRLELLQHCSGTISSVEANILSSKQRYDAALEKLRIAKQEGHPQSKIIKYEQRIQNWNDKIIELTEQLNQAVISAGETLCQETASFMIKELYLSKKINKGVLTQKAVDNINAEYMAHFERLQQIEDMNVAGSTASVEKLIALISEKIPEYKDYMAEETDDSSVEQ